MQSQSSARPDTVDCVSSRMTNAGMACQLLSNGSSRGRARLLVEARKAYFETITLQLPPNGALTLRSKSSDGTWMFQRAQACGASLFFK